MDEDAIAPVLEHLDRYDPGGVLGVYLYGSAVAGGLRPGSDIDLLMLTRASLDPDERSELLAVLLETSGWGGHGARHPEATRRRPIELTSVVAAETSPWTPRPREDFQFGEWLRDAFLEGEPSLPREDPDLLVLAATALSAHRVLRGAPLEEVMAPLPQGRLESALLATIPGLMADLLGDERNVLLTLARVIVTLRTGEIVPKDRAARTIAASLPEPGAALLEKARRDYLDGRRGDWTDHAQEVRELAEVLARTARTAAAPDGPVRGSDQG